MVAAVLICDDSNLARKQMARSLPAQWQDKIFFAGHGQEALEVLKRQPIDLLFLDLNMPIMDGYQVLAEIKQRKLQLNIVVVSGDVQPEAIERVKQLGALDFIRKPVDSHKLQQLMQQQPRHSPHLPKSSQARKSRSKKQFVHSKIKGDGSKVGSKNCG